jgi:hypothetical protein
MIQIWLIGGDHTDLVTNIIERGHYVKYPRITLAYQKDAWIGLVVCVFLNRIARQQYLDDLAAADASLQHPPHGMRAPEYAAVFYRVTPSHRIVNHAQVPTPL